MLVNFEELKNGRANTVWINPAQVISVRQKEMGAEITVVEEVISVVNPIESVLAKLHINA